MTFSWYATQGAHKGRQVRDLPSDDYDGNVDPGACFLRIVHAEIIALTAALVALQAYQASKIQLR